MTIEHSTRQPTPEGSPLYPRQVETAELAGWWYWSGRLVPDAYTDVVEEMRAVRTAAGLTDMSQLSKYVLSGPDATAVVDRIITRDVRKLEVGQVYFTPWCNEDGHVVSEGLVVRLAEDRYITSSNPMTRWFAKQAEGADVEIDDVTKDLAILSLQGPRTQEILEAASGESWAGFRFSRRRATEIAGVELDVLRQGFTGEHGYELWIPSDGAIAVWDRLFEVGDPVGLKPFGLNGIDLGRLEGGMIIGGPDYAPAEWDPEGPDNLGSKSQRFLISDAKSTPGEIGMGRLVDFEKGDFIGRDALVAERDSGGPRRQLVGLELDWRTLLSAQQQQETLVELAPRVHWDPKDVVVDGERIGRATSQGWSPTLRRFIAFGCIAREHAEIGQQLLVRWPIGDALADVPTTVVPLPFVEQRRAA